MATPRGASVTRRAGSRSAHTVVEAPVDRLHPHSRTRCNGARGRPDCNGRRARSPAGAASNFCPGRPGGLPACRQDELPDHPGERMIRLSVVAFLSAAALCAQDISMDGGPAWRDFSILFTPKIEPASVAVGQLNSAVVDAAVTGAAHRFIYDEKIKRAFGYDVSLEPSADGSTAQLRIEPLSDPQWAIRNGWAMWGAAPSGLPKYPVIPNLRMGDKIALDLLVNPTTGQKIVDYLPLIEV